MSRIATYAVLIVLTLITIYPILVVVNISLRPSDALYSTSLRLIPEGATLKAFRVVLFEKAFLVWLRNSLVVAGTVTILGITLASTAGYAFSRYRFRGHGAGLITLLVTQMFPATMLLLPLYVLMSRLGLVNTFLGVIIAYTATALPFTIWTMKGYYDTIPKDLEEAARVDGTSHLGAFWRVVLPLARPALMITGLFAFMSAWSEYIVARVILNSQALYTLPLGLAELAGNFQTEWANYAAASLLVSVPVVALFLVLNQFVVSGLTLGGVKG